MRFWAFSILVVGLLLFGCSDRNRHADKTVFRYNESKGVTSLDPAQARTMGNIWATTQLFNGLVQLNDKMEVEPSIAKRWTISQDGLTYRFVLRDDVVFHNHEAFVNGKGRVVVASDFEFSFKRILDEKTLSPGRWIFNAVDQSKEGGFKAINDSVFEIYLKQSFPPFLGILSIQYCSVVPKEVVEKLGKDFSRNPVGTGPFKFKEWYEGIKLVLHKNENYFESDTEGNQLPYLDAIGISFIPDPQSIFLEFMKGNLDMLSGLEDGSYKDALITPNGNLQPELNEKLVMYSEPFLNTEYLGFLMKDSIDGKPNVLTDKRIRQAINYGFDRRKMMRYIRNNIGSPGVHGFLPTGLPGEEFRVEGYAYDPQKAKQLLIEAGYPNGEGLPEIQLYTTSQYLDLCEYMQHQLQEIGIKLSIEVNPGATHGALVANSQVPFFRKSWIADYADAENYLSLFYSKNHTPDGPNYTLFENESFDDLYESSLATTSDSLRYRYYAQMDSIIVEEAPVVVLYYDQVLRFTHKNISGLSTNSMNGLSLKTVRKTNP
ncbi:MAG: ABC transporter substrate-binding protein [Flavobacteriales bacterium]|nr:ABC transporter substrate-binding protein [Flavobacteriales bacterium]MCB9190428.1 ABC transporter substrate-binding protein [Flavobacteriales bacterium]MCB9204678.1 ABC transporter substrate-binding protein [Flavobacteriales bacterium]